jgi:dienelactone hydrolase
MRKRPAGLWIVTVVVSALLGRPATAGEKVTLSAADGVTVYGEYWGTGDRAMTLVLLFHQAGSNRGEYAPIAVRLVAEGHNALAIDQRSGGSRWGQSNKTVRQLGHSTGFGETLPDLEAALAWARSSGHTGPVLLWGSSYSAALVFLVAAKHPREVAGVLAFSPGEYISGASIRGAAAKLNIPVFVTSASDREEVAAARDLLDAVPAARKEQLVPRQGVHGSSTLRADQNPKGAEENWHAVSAFLAPFR